MKILDFFKKDELFLDWNFMKNKYGDFVNDMKNCQQNPEYHGEGDVFTHTQMVHTELLKLPEFIHLIYQEQQILELAVFFHDIAKPNCTILENGKITSPRHAKVGEKITRSLLWNLDFEIREQICSLVRLHGLPIWAITKQNPNLEVIKSSYRIDNSLLYILTKADILGRICSDKDREEMLFRLECFKELCLENDCWNKPKSFSNQHSRFKFFQKNESFVSELFDDTEFTIFIMCGIPGSGKDFQANKISTELNIPIVSLDELRLKFKIPHEDKNGQGKIIQEANKIAKEYCAKKQSFIWNATNLTSDNRQKLINMFSVYNPKIEIVYIETSKANIFSRRNGIIKKEILELMFEKIDIPQLSECHNLKIIKNEN